MRSPLIVLLFAVVLGGCGARRSQPQKIPRIGLRETGIASWYGEPYHGRRAANGEIYDMEKLTAAHRTLAFDTWLRVVNLSNDKSVVVRVTDRGPFIEDRIIDLSRAAARQIDMLQAGITRVRLEVIAAAPASAPAVSTSREESDPASNSRPPQPSGATSPGPSPPPPPYGGGKAGETNVNSNRRFTLQAGAFRDESNARTLAQRLSTYDPTIRVSYDLDTLNWKVTIGTFYSPREADGLAARLRSQGIDIFVVEWVP